MVGHREYLPGAFLKVLFCFDLIFKTDAPVQCLGIYLFQAEFCKGHEPLFCKCLEEQTKPTDPSNADWQRLEGMGPRCSNERLITFAPKASILTVLYHSFCRRWRTAVSGVLRLRSLLQLENPPPFGIRVKERDSESTAGFVFAFARLSILFNFHCLSGGRTIRSPLSPPRF